MANVMVTGGAGFIGSNFVRYYRDRHPTDDLVILDALTYAGNYSNIADLVNKDCRFVHGSINDTALVAELLSEHKIDTVVHFAAESHVDRSITGPSAFIETNVLGTHSLLSACRMVWIEERKIPHRFHHVSTDEVFGTLGPDDPAFTEDTPYAPNSPYSASKAGADHLVRAYQHTYGLSATISNCSNNYGPYQFPEKLIPLAIMNLLTGKRVPVYGEGANIRDWLHVTDHCAAIDVILQEPVAGRTYNIGSNSERPNLEVVRSICEIVDAEFLENPGLKTRFPLALAAGGISSAEAVEFVDDRAGHDFRYAIDGKRAREELGFSCSIKFGDGLRETVRWYIENESWWRGVIDGSYRDVVTS